MFDIIWSGLSSIFRYIFILLIYLFMFGIIRLIFLDIKGIKNKEVRGDTYLKLINRKDSLPFKVDEFYSLVSDVSIGRSRNNKIIIKDPYISKQHAQIIKNRDEYYLEDLSSANGTYVNGEQITNAVKLMNGDTIQVGRVNFLFVIEQ
ncbi:FHA domain-containing protein [Clostridium sp. D2Q-11]|uniref:FHA domain-containing protein n=1 Tax=Anaeromonas frigoriresistens TaxID=2683708 RepID=A0A942Z7T8_9FIRM|nr:FHA domain-containing protein [Anaeromonas frigoriresistens]MBS4537249.1 FHA domain-containing protein [Anaeromonas frigoriresistens]